jgi:hypothetical protein
VSVNGTLVEAKMCTFTLVSTHFIFNKFPIYIHDGASAKFSTNSHETDYCVPRVVWGVFWEVKSISGILSLHMEESCLFIYVNLNC